MPLETAYFSQEETMATNLTNFLLSLGENPQQVQAFKQNPQAVMAAAGLTQAEQNLILSGDVHTVHQHLLVDPDLKNAMGITTSQPHPTRIPMFIFPPRP
jgi:cytochrome P450